MEGAPTTELIENDNPNRWKIHVLTSAMAGGICCSLVDMALYPVDTLKTRAHAAPPNEMKLRAIIGNNWRTLFTGIWTSMAQLPACFSFFVTYENLKVYLDTIFDQHAHVFLSHFIAGTAGETASIIVRNPMEVCKQQMQIGLDNNIVDTFKSIYRSKGLMGYYAGVGSFWFREVPFAAIQMPFYELFKKLSLGKDRKEEDLTFLESARNGSLSGIIGSYLTNPIDVVKTTIMVSREREKSTIFNTAKQIYREQGFRGFMRGSTYRVVYTASNSFFFFSSYEFTKGQLRKTLLADK